MASNCVCTEPQSFEHGPSEYGSPKVKAFFHRIDVTPNSEIFSGFLDSCNAPEGSVRYAVTCHDYDGGGLQQGSSSWIPLIAAIVCCLILCIVTFHLHRKNRELQEQISKQENDTKENDNRKDSENKIMAENP